MQGLKVLHSKYFLSDSKYGQRQPDITSIAGMGYIHSNEAPPTYRDYELKLIA